MINNYKFARHIFDFALAEIGGQGGGEGEGGGETEVEE